MINTSNQRLLLWCIAIIAVVSIGQLPPISQAQSYHMFADTHVFLGIPNALNVISNFPFFVIGLYGITIVLQRKVFLGSAYWGALTFSIGVVLVTLGSGYYHLFPNSFTLAWDRLPISISIMGLYAAILSAFIEERSGLTALPWLIIAGILSVVY